MDAVVLAAGEGTRLRPLSYAIPKPLLPVAGRPCLDYVVANLRTLPVDRVVVAAGPGRDALERYVAHVGYGVPVVSVPCPGHETGGDLRAAVRSAGVEGTFVACNGDTITRADLGPLLDHHRRTGAGATIALFEVDEGLSRFGVAHLDGDLVTRFVEKPDQPTSRLASMGYYVIERAELDALPDGPSRLEVDLFPALAVSGRLGGLVMRPPFWLDIGTLDSYLAANRLALEGRIVPPEGR